jgi:hypothetical protein
MDDPMIKFYFFTLPELPAKVALLLKSWRRL